MKIWRRDSSKQTKPNKAQEQEQLTDISTASTPSDKDSKKDKMEEIYSTKDKQVKYKRQTPLEAEEAEKRALKAKVELASGKAEIELETPKNDKEFVELTSDYEEGTVIADDIIEDVAELSPKKERVVQDIDDIDIDIDPKETVKKYERQAGSTTRHDERYKKIYENEFERIFGRPKYDVSGEKVVAKIPTYQHDSKINLITLKAGRFTDVVESEYDEYLKSSDVAVSPRQKGSQKTEHKSKKTSVSAEKSAVSTEPAKPKKPEGKIHKALRITKTIIYKKIFKFKPKTKADKTAAPPKTHTQQESRQVMAQIKGNFTKLATRGLLLCVLFLVSLVLTFMETAKGAEIFNGTAQSALIFCAINLGLLILCAVVAFPFIKNGLKPLKRFKGNSDTAVACAFVACFVQQISSIFVSSKFVGATLHLYTAIVILGFTLNILGRLFMVYRVKKNFSYVTQDTPSHNAKIYADAESSRKMLSGTTASHSFIAYQHPTDNLSDFLKISYAPDPSEELSGKFAPITIVCSVFVAIVYGILAKTFVGALSALAVMMCISIPLCSLLLGNVPMLFLCKDALKHHAMISGYPSVKQFAESNAVMLTAKDLYPKTSIKLNTVKNFVDYRAEESLLMAALVMKEADSPLYRLFKKLIKKHSHSSLMKVESVLYEDKLGLVGWINGERVLIGNRKLLDRYHIYLDDAADEAKYQNKGMDVTYIACAGQLVCMLVTSYKPDKLIKQELSRAQNTGLCIVVTTTDCNITAEKIAADYDVFYRTIKILPSGFAAQCNEVTHTVEEASRAYLCTQGKFHSLIHAVTGCISFKNNLTIGLIVQIFGLILGVLLCATMVLYDSVAILGVPEMLLYMLFWGLATIAVQFIKRP